MVILLRPKKCVLAAVFLKRVNVVNTCVLRKVDQRSYLAFKKKKFIHLIVHFPITALMFRYCYGNFDRYYGARLEPGQKDSRLSILQKEWFEKKSVLDIGWHRFYISRVI